MKKILLALVAAMAVPTSAVASTNYLFYTVETLRWGASEHRLALPRTFPSQGDLVPSAVVGEAFHKLKSFRGAAYADASVQLDPNFAATGAVTVTLGKAAKAETAVVVSEVYWTLVSAGAREVRIPEVTKDALTDRDPPFGVAQIVVQLWQVLPPGAPGPGFVRGSEGLLSAHEVQRKLEAKDRAVVAEVFGLLSSPTPYVRLAAVRALGKLDLPKKEANLLPLLQDPEITVKTEVLRSLDGTKSKKALAALEVVVQNDPDAAVQSAAARILSAAGIQKYAVIVLYDKLGDQDDAVVMDAVQKLEASKKPEVATALVNVLTHRNSRVREMAMKAIQGLGNDEALRKVVQTEAIDAALRNQAAKTLSAKTGESGELGLRRLMAHGQPEAQRAAIAEVSKRRLYKLVTDVIAQLESPDASVRLAAAKALGEIKDSKALPALSKALAAHADEKDAYEAAIISVFGGLSIEEVIKTADSTDKALRRLSIKSLARFAQGARPQPRVLDVLKKKLADSEPGIRRSAAFALARIDDPGVVDSLVALVEDRDAEIREQVAVALTRSKHAKADTILMKYVEDSNTGVRRAAVDGLRERDVKSALEKLKFHVKHRDVEVRRAVVRATVDLAGADGWEQWFPVWSEALYDLDPQVKTHALKGIGYRPNDARVPSLVGGLTTDPNPKVQQAALEVLGRTGAREAIEYAARALFEGTKDTKLAALAALAAINLEECGKPIEEFVKNEQDAALRNKANEVYDNLP